MRKVAFSFFLIVVLACSATLPKKQMINGVSYVASNEPINQENIDPVLEINANYASVMPFGFIRNLNSPEVIYNTNRQWFGETKDGTRQYINELKKNNIKIMLKPQLWVWRGAFTGEITMQTEEDWKIFEDSYLNYIIDYAKLAEELEIEIFCIGTELNTFVSRRPDYWKRLIKEIKSVYNGKLTYAENWDTFANVPFWENLDYIGIDAYFPLSEEKQPSELELIEGWKPHKTKMRMISKKLNKQILFTEYGYRSIDFAAKEPWNASRTNETVNLQAQTVTLKVLYNQFWKEDWFAGGFLWKWYHDHENGGGHRNSRFTPQNKPAQSIIKEHYFNN